MNENNDGERNGDAPIMEQGSSTNTKRAKRSTFVAWLDFEKLPLSEDGRQRAICKLCKTAVYIVDTNAGTSNLHKHITNCRRDMDDSVRRHITSLDQDM